MNRRDFLAHTAAALTVGALLPKTASAQTDFQKADGQNYAPKGKPHPVVKAGEFVFARLRILIFSTCVGLRYGHLIH